MSKISFMIGAGGFGVATLMAGFGYGGGAIFIAWATGLIAGLSK